MSSQGLRKLREKLAADEEARARLSAATSVGELVLIAGELGCDVQEEDLAPNPELTDADLAVVAGASDVYTMQDPCGTDFVTSYLCVHTLPLC